MGRVSGGMLLARQLQREGVKYVFALCGGHINPIFAGCAEMGMPVIDVRHEQAAAHAAAGWARATGEPGAAIVTAGPGLTDAISGIAEAFISEIPMVVIGGRIPLADFDRGALQDLDQVRLLEPITRWARTIYDPKRIPEYVNAAFQKAVTPPRGPTYIECPLDLLMSEIEEGEVLFPSPHRPPDFGPGSPEAISKATEMLLEAQRPAVLAGDDIFWDKGADAALRRFVDATRIPLRTTGLAQGAVPTGHPLLLGQAATAMADVILALGVRFDFLEGFGRPPLFDANARFIQVCVNGGTIGFNRPAEVGIVGSPRHVLDALAQEIGNAARKPDRSEWLAQARAVADALQAQAEAAYTSDAQPIHPARLAREVVEFLDPDAIIVPDGGDSSCWLAGTLRPAAMGRVLSTGAFGCLGVGTGFALAAKLAYPERRVLGFFGDGSFGFNGMEFDTFVRHRLPIVAVIANDAAWGMVKHWQRMSCGEEKCVGMALKSRQRYDRMVEALGGHGEYVTRIEEIKPALERAFASGLPACVNVEVDPNAMSPATMWMYQSLAKK